MVFLAFCSQNIKLGKVALTSYLCQNLPELLIVRTVRVVRALLKGVARKSRGSLGTQCSQENPKGVELHTRDSRESFEIQGRHWEPKRVTKNPRESLETQGSHLELKGGPRNSKKS